MEVYNIFYEINHNRYFKKANWEEFCNSLDKLNNKQPSEGYEDQYTVVDTAALNSIPKFNNKFNLPFFHHFNKFL